MTSSVIKQAQLYAKARWCWDDDSAIEEIIGDANDAADAKQLIDHAAEKYGLEDPRDYGLP